MINIFVNTTNIWYFVKFSSNLQAKILLEISFKNLHYLPDLDLSYIMALEKSVYLISVHPKLGHNFFDGYVLTGCLLQHIQIESSLDGIHVQF